MMKKSKDKDRPKETGFETGLGGILMGLSGLVEKLGELAETGEQLHQTGELGGAGKGVKGIYGFTVKVGLGEEQTRVEPFGNIRRDEKTGQTVVREIREPVVDVFDEAGHLLIVAEMPGINAADVKLHVKDDLLTITAARGDKKYCKEVLLPRSFTKEKISLTCNNGVVEIKCVK